jgi:hypothetical protein
MPGTQSTPKTKRDLILLLNANTQDWETARVRKGLWFAIATSNLNPRPTRASATNERQAMENLCKRMKLL